RERFGRNASLLLAQPGSCAATRRWTGSAVGRWCGPLDPAPGMRSKALFLALRYLFSHGQLLQVSIRGVFLFLIPSPKLFIAGAGGPPQSPRGRADHRPRVAPQRREPSQNIRTTVRYTHVGYE